MRFPTMMRKSVKGRSALHGRPAESSACAALAQGGSNRPETHDATRRMPRRAARAVVVVVVVVVAGKN